MNTSRYTTNSPKETEALGEKLAQQCKSGDILTFSGDLGAGKTAFTRGFAQGLHITTSVTSPTFTIVHEYTQGTLPLFHFDLYRLHSSEDLFDLGFEEYFYREGICIIEWSEKAGDFWEEWREEHPNNQHFAVDITHGEHELQRVIAVTEHL